MFTLVGKIKTKLNKIFSEQLENTKKKEHNYCWYDDKFTKNLFLIKLINHYYIL